MAIDVANRETGIDSLKLLMIYHACCRISFKSSQCPWISFEACVQLVNIFFLNLEK